MNSYPAHARFQKQKEAFLRGDMKTVKKLAEEARQKLESKGFVKTNLFGWIEREWLEKALKEDVVVKKEVGYVPAVIEREEEIVTGHRGRVPIIEKKTKLDISIWREFCKEYEEYKNRKERQQYVIDEEMGVLVESSSIGQSSKGK